MKITKKVTSIVLALLMTISAFTCLTFVAGAATPTEDGATLHIYKYEGVGGEIGLDQTADGWKGEENAAAVAGKTPIQGVTFTAWKIGNMNMTVPTTEADAYDTSDLGAGKTMTTDSTGHAKMDVTSDDYGLYVVKETSSPDKVTTESVGFYVYLPMTNENGDGFLYDVYVYPKNVITLGGSMLTKTVNRADYDKTKIQTAPVFELYEELGDDDTKIATFTLPSATAAGSATVDVATTAGTRYEAVKVAVSDDGKIAVNGLPTAFETDRVSGKKVSRTATYYWKEKSGATLTDGTVIPVNTQTPTFTVSAGQSGEVDVAEWTVSGSAQEITFDNSQTSTIKKEVQLQDDSYADNSSDPAGTVNNTYDIGESFNWKVTVDIPADIATYKKFVITDTIKTTLDYKSTTVGSLIADTDYKISAPAVDEDGLITITFVDTDNSQNPSEALKALAGQSLEIIITTAINSTAAVDTAITNQAKLSFDNNAGSVKDVLTSEPKVFTGGFKIEKVDAANSETKLSGVEFTLYDGDTAVNVVKTGTADGDYVVCPAGTEGATTTLITDTNGLIKVKGLQYSASPTSQYTLVETKTKAGYQLLTEPVDIIVAADRYDTAVQIQNPKQPKLPITGGMGTILFTVAGLVLIGGAAFFFIRSRKSSKEEA